MPILQIIFLAIGAFIVLSLKPLKAEVTLLLWQLFVGFTQVISAIFLTYKHWELPFLKKAFGFYWLLVVVAFVLLGTFIHTKGALRLIVLFIIPWSTAIYFTILVLIVFYSKKINFYNEK